MTPELGKVSESRRQTGGVRSVAEGTVSQIHYLMKNKDGKTYALKLARIDEVLYDEKTRGDRKIFQQKREEFLRDKKSFESAYLATFNNKIDESRNAEQQELEAAEYERVNQIWNFNKYTEELPMCIIATGYNNNAKFRIEYHLNSVFQQNYTNYFLVLINDASTDNSDEVYRKWFDFYNIDKSKYVYI